MMTKSHAQTARPHYTPPTTPWVEAIVEDNMLLLFIDGIIDSDFHTLLQERYDECSDTVDEIIIELKDAILLDSSVPVLIAVERFAREKGLYIGMTNASAALKRDLSYPGCSIDWLN